MQTDQRGKTEGLMIMLLETQSDILGNNGRVIASTG